MSALLAYLPHIICAGVILAGLASGTIYLKREMRVLQEEVRRCHEHPEVES